MKSNFNYTPGPANLARIHKNGDEWTLVLVRIYNYSPETVWQRSPNHTNCGSGAPFDSDKNLGTLGRVTLSTVGTPYTSETEVTLAEAPRLLEYSWGGKLTRWQLEPTETGTRLTLWAKIDRNFIAMGAAGWHLCFDVMDLYLSGTPIGRIVSEDALHFEGWQRLHAEYSEQFGLELPGWASKQGE